MLLSNLNLLATAPGGVARLRELILTLAVQGKLVAQDPKDEPASELLKKIRAEKDRLISEGKIKRDKPLAVILEEDKPFEVPRGWEWVKFGDVTLISSGITLGRKTPITSPTMLPYLRVANVQRWHLNLTSMKEVMIDHSELERFQLCKDDLLITEGGDWDKVGRTTVWRSELPICLHQNHVFKARGTSGDWNPIWAELYLNSPVARSYFASAAKQTTNLASINMTQLKNCVFPVPPLAEQASIVTRVAELMRLCDALEAKQHSQLVSTLFDTLLQSPTPEALAENWQRVATHFDLLLDRPQAVDALEQTILQLAVRGQLVPQDPTDEPASQLLKAIRQEKDRLILEGKIKRDKPLPPIAEEEKPFALPHGWEWVRLGSMTSLVTSGSRSWKDFYSTDGATFIRSQDIKHDRLEFDNRAFVKLPENTEGSRTQVCHQDLLITITGANVGKAAMVSVSLPEAYVSQHVALVRMQNMRLVEYIHLWLVSEHEGRKLLLMSSYGAKPGLNLQNINDLLVPIPPLPEQVRIVARVEELRRLCTDLRQRLTRSQTVQSQLAEALVAEVATT